VVEVKVEAQGGVSTACPTVSRSVSPQWLSQQQRLRVLCGYNYTPEIHTIAEINMFEMAGGRRGGTLAREGGKVKPCEAPWLGLCQGSFPS
jgi:hypothetical protein